MTDDSHTVQMRFTKEGLCKCFSEMFIRSNARGHSKPPYLTAKIPISCYGRTHSAVIEKSKHSHYKVTSAAHSVWRRNLISVRRSCYVFLAVDK